LSACICRRKRIFHATQNSELKIEKKS